MLCAKEIKGLCEAGSALGYKDDELREFVKPERLRLEKEKQIQFEKEEKEREMEKLRFEAQKIEANRAEKQ